MGPAREDDGGRESKGGAGKLGQTHLAGLRGNPLICQKCGKRMRIISIITHDPVVPTILKHLTLPWDVPVLAPARRTGRGPPEEDEAGATPCPEEHWCVDEAPSNEDYLTNGPGWEDRAGPPGLSADCRAPFPVKNATRCP